jgi:hypothetical protein
MILTFTRSVFASCGALLIALLANATCALVVEAQSTEAPTKVAEQPLTAEPLAVYRKMLVSCFQGKRAKVNLEAGVDSADKTCLKGLSWEAVVFGQVHRIRPEDLAQLGPFEFRLVEPNAGGKEVSDNDPGKATQKGKTVDEAVANGFAHGPLTIREIRFDKAHTHALVSFSFVCGGLCGNGTTMLLEKKDGTWKKKAQCGGWVS